MACNLCIYDHYLILKGGIHSVNGVNCMFLCKIKERMYLFPFDLLYIHSGTFFDSINLKQRIFSFIGVIGLTTFYHENSVLHIGMSSYLKVKISRYYNVIERIQAIFLCLQIYILLTIPSYVQRMYSILKLIFIFFPLYLFSTVPSIYIAVQ